MRILKSHPLLKMVNSYVVDSPQPSNISYLWNFGSLLAFCLIIQIVTGVTLGMHYTPNVFEAFDSIEHIMRDVNNGWLIRYLHSNTASAFFFLVYLHIGRGLYYASYKAPRTLTWIIGTIILIVMMATAFLGYLHSPKWYELFSKHIYTYNSIMKFKRKRYYSTDNGNNENKTKNELLIKLLKENNLNPVYIYEDLHLEDTKNLIRKETDNLSGIYLIFNKITGDYYIGSASTNKFFARFSNHLIYFRGNKIIKHAVKKYKLNNFVFLILELFPEIVNKENNKKLLDLEDFYLKSLLPNYNILTEAGSSFGYKHTELTRIKMKANYSLERREFIGNLNKDKKLSLETIEKIRKKALTRKNRFFSDKALLNMKKKSKPIILYNLNNTIFGEYPSISEAAKSINCSVKTINRALKTDKKILKRRFIVQYISLK